MPDTEKIGLLPELTDDEHAAALAWHQNFYRKWMREIAPLMREHTGARKEGDEVE